MQKNNVYAKEVYSNDTTTGPIIPHVFRKLFIHMFTYIQYLWHRRWRCGFNLGGGTTTVKNTFIEMSPEDWDPPIFLCPILLHTSVDACECLSAVMFIGWYWFSSMCSDASMVSLVLALVLITDI